MGAGQMALLGIRECSSRTVGLTDLAQAPSLEDFLGTGVLLELEDFHRRVHSTPTKIHVS